MRVYEIVKVNFFNLERLVVRETKDVFTFTANDIILLPLVK